MTQEVALGLGGGVGGARAPVEKRDLAEHRAGPEQVEDHLLARPGDRANADPPGQHHEQLVAGIALAEQHLAGLDALDPGAGEQPV